MRVDRWVKWVRETLMALTIRLEYAGAGYHVMARGNRGGTYTPTTATASSG
jgi:hypothetical protein